MVLVVAMYSILIHIPLQPEPVGPVCVWQIGRVKNVTAISGHHVPGSGLLRLGRELAHRRNNTLALVSGWSILNSITRQCFQNGLRNVERIGDVCDLCVLAPAFCLVTWCWGGCVFLLMLNWAHGCFGLCLSTIVLTIVWRLSGKHVFCKCSDDTLIKSKVRASS